MKQPLIFLITLLYQYLWFAVALGNGWTNFKQGFFRNRKQQEAFVLILEDVLGCKPLKSQLKLWVSSKASAVLILQRYVHKI